jgi:hypothetical protein
LVFKAAPSIAPKWYIVTTQGAVTEEGHAITPTDCIESDIDSEIDNLIEQLNEIRKQAKRRYKGLHVLK